MSLGSEWEDTDLITYQYPVNLHLQVEIILPAQTELKVSRSQIRRTEKAMEDGKDTVLHCRVSPWRS